jgi:hypothetical protein
VPGQGECFVCRTTAMSLYEGSVLVPQEQKDPQDLQDPQGLQDPQERLSILSQCVVVEVVRASAIVRVVKLRARLLALRPQGAL